MGCNKDIFVCVFKKKKKTKESLGVRFEDGIFAELCLKLWFESDWYFHKRKIFTITMNLEELKMVKKFSLN